MFMKGLPTRGSMPVHLMLEEAHRYVQKDNDINILGYNIFERIAKEGRKFGVVIDLILKLFYHNVVISLYLKLTILVTWNILKKWFQISVVMLLKSKSLFNLVLVLLLVK